MEEQNAVVRRSAPATPEDRWHHLHPPHGTCVVGCPSYGTCHCGCSGRPKQSKVTYADGRCFRNRPYVFVPGHHLRVIHPRAGSWSKNGVDVEKIRPLVFWLRERHGSIRGVADLMGMPESTLRGYAYNTKPKRVPAPNAKRIVALVLAHRRRVDLSDSWG
jgi:hypothetical protein